MEPVELSLMYMYSIALLYIYHTYGECSELNWNTGTEENLDYCYVLYILN